MLRALRPAEISIPELLKLHLGEVFGRDRIAKLIMKRSVNSSERRAKKRNRQHRWQALPGDSWIKNAHGAISKSTPYFPSKTNTPATSANTAKTFGISGKLSAGAIVLKPYNTSHAPSSNMPMFLGNFMESFQIGMPSATEDLFGHRPFRFHFVH
jgi:hypothetical protein